MNGDGDVLEFSGERYITSARAAKLFGYTKDYVGQLARGGKIRARLVGRSWYVSEDSTREHKLETHYVLTKPKKSPHEEESVVGEKSIKHVDISVPRSFENSITPPSQVHTGGHAHASRELARADFRYEGGQALTLDDSYVPLDNEYRILHRAHRALTIEEMHQPEVLSGKKREDVSLDSVLSPSITFNSATPVLKDVKMVARATDKSVPTSVTDSSRIGIRLEKERVGNRVHTRLEKKASSRELPRRVLGADGVAVRGRARQENGKGGKWGQSPLLSPKRIPVLVGLGGMGILVLLQLI